MYDETLGPTEEWAEMNTIYPGDDVYILRALRRAPGSGPCAYGKWSIELITGNHAKIERFRRSLLKNKFVDEITVDQHKLG